MLKSIGNVCSYIDTMLPPYPGYRFKEMSTIYSLEEFRNTSRETVV